jgi:hypothetical protein
MSTFWTRKFWAATGERAIKTIAQTLGAALLAKGTGILETDWIPLLSVSGMAGLLSVLTSVGGSKLARRDGPSLATERLAGVGLKFGLAAGLLLVATGCQLGELAKAPDAQLLDASEATYTVVAPDHAEYLRNDPDLTPDQRSRRLRTLAAWRAGLTSNGRDVPAVTSREEWTPPALGTDNGGSLGLDFGGPDEEAR